MMRFGWDTSIHVALQQRALQLPAALRTANRRMTRRIKEQASKSNSIFVTASAEPRAHPVHDCLHDVLQVHSQKTRALPATAVGKSADLATAGVKHGTEELLEVWHTATQSCQLWLVQPVQCVIANLHDLATILHPTDSRRRAPQVLTTPQGQKFVRSMAANVVEGYLQSARTDLFKQAAKEGAAAGFNGTMEVTQSSAHRLGRHDRRIKQRWKR